MTLSRTTLRMNKWLDEKLSRFAIPIIGFCLVGAFWMLLAMLILAGGRADG